MARRKKTSKKRSPVHSNEVKLPKGAIRRRTKQHELTELTPPKLQPQSQPVEISDAVSRARDILREKLTSYIAEARASKRRSGQRAGFENIGAITVGEKIQRGERKGIPCIRVHVLEKLPPDRVSKAAIIPSHVDGIPTDVIRTGNIEAHQASTVFRPANGGCSMAFRGITRGTAACVVSIPAPGLPGGREFAFLGNNHTFAACNTAAIDDWIVQPSRLDGGAFPEYALARLRRFVPLDFTPDGWNEVDCAVAAARTQDCATGVFGIGTIEETTVEPVRGRQVIKVGASTGLTYGKIDDPDVWDWVIYREPSVRSARFRQLMKISALSLPPFSDRGDSGALIVEVETRRPVGLLIGGDASFSYACRITTVMSSFDAKIA